MNGFTLASGYFHRPNLCQCGHSAAVHTITFGGVINSNLCSLCIVQAGVQNKHFFAARMETIPAPSFLATGRYGYCNAGGFGFIFTLFSSNVTTLPSGTTAIPFVAPQLAVVKPGMTIVVLGTNPANTQIYQILNVTGANVNIAPPGLNFNMGANNPCYFGGSFGSSMGSGLAANNQRGG